MSDEQEPARTRLSNELQMARSDFSDEFHQVTRNWIPVPHIPRLLPKPGPRLNSGGIGMLVWSLHAVLFLIGVTLSLVSDQANSLGLSLVVGSLFGVGAIGAQVWNAAHQREAELRHRALGDFQYEELMRLGARVQELAAQLRALDSHHGPAPETDSPASG